jgi:DNA topoisomerase IB
MTFALLLRYWRELTIAVLITAGMTECHRRDVALRAAGVALERARVADSTLRAIAPKLARVDTQLVHDTVRVRVAVDRVVTLRDTVLAHLTDTVLVKQFVTRADSAAQACVELSSSCQAFRAYATQTIAALEAKAAAAPAISRRSCVTQDVVALLLGAAGGYAAHRR